MQSFREDFIQIYHTDKVVLLLMILNLFVATGLFIFSIVSLNPEASVIKVGYGDIGGYRDGTWVDLIAFPILAFVFGITHSLLATRIFHKRGAGMTKFFLIITTFLILGGVLVLIRLLGEG